MMNLTAEQLAIRRAAAELGKRSSMKIQAFAGSGKTTTLAAVAESLPQQDFLYLTFNRAAADEAKRKMPPNVKASTAHSRAYAKIGYRYGARLATSDWQWLPYLKEYLPDAFQAVVRAGRSPSAAGALIIHTLQQFLRTTDETLGSAHAPSWCSDQLRKALVEAATQLWRDIGKAKSVAPVTHDCYLKMFFLEGRALAAKNCIVLFDEAQDADPVILGLLGHHQGPRIVVGDKYQQLYQWRGAVNALDEMPAEVELALTQTFRFGEGVAWMANMVLDIIGEEMRIVPAAHESDTMVRDSAITDVLLARTNAGALDAAVSQLNRGRHVYVMGGIDPLINLIRGAWDLHQGGYASGELAMFVNWEELETVAKGQGGEPGDAGLQMLVRLIADRGADVLKMCDQLKACVTSPEFADVTISTTHKAKGLEWPSVFMAPDFAQFVRLEEVGPDGEKAPVINVAEAMIAYVAITRARHELIISPKSQEAITASVAAWGQVGTEVAEGAEGDDGRAGA